MDTRPYRYPTPTGQPCPHTVRASGEVVGSGACAGCACCLLLPAAAWPDLWTDLDDPPQHRYVPTHRAALFIDPFAGS